MNIDCICINSTFNQECLELYAKHGVKIPEKNKIYSIRTKQRHSNGKWGIKLNEIINPKIPLESALLPDSWVEVSWDILRFTDLLSNPLLEEKDDIFEPELEEIKINKFYEVQGNKKYS